MLLTYFLVIKCKANLFESNFSGQNALHLIWKHLLALNSNGNTGSQSTGPSAPSTAATKQKIAKIIKICLDTHPEEVKQFFETIKQQQNQHNVDASDSESDHEEEEEEGED